MKKFLTIIIFCLISNSSFADKLQGSFFCEEKFADGSSGKFTLKIFEDNILVRDIRFKEPSKYKKIYQLDNFRFNYKMFVSDFYGELYIIYPTKNENKIPFVSVVTGNPLSDRNIIGEGTCDKV